MPIVALALLSVAIGATAGEPPPILVSRQLAERYGLAPGDVALFSAARDGSDPRPFRIAGTYEPVPDPMQLARTRHEARFHLADLTDLLAGGDPGAADRVSAIHVRLRRPDASDELRTALARKAPSLAVTPAAPSASSVATFEVLDRFHFAIAIVTVLGSTTFLLALMIMRAAERRETIGILRLIGLPRSRILLAVLAEGMLVAVAGAAAGLVFAVMTQGAVNRFFQWHYDTALVFVRVTPAVAARSLAIALPLGVLASVAASLPLLGRDVAGLLRR
jgi:putative ABC transport system permease protein